MVNEANSVRNYGSNEALLLNQNVAEPSAAIKVVEPTLAGVDKTSDSPDSERSCLSHRSISVSPVSRLPIPPNSPAISRQSDSTESSVEPVCEANNSEKLTSSNTKGICISSMALMENLKTIVVGKGVWQRVLNCGLGCFYDTFDTTTDKDWLEYLQRWVRVVDHFTGLFWQRKPEPVREVIHLILFSAFRAVQRFDHVTRQTNSERVAAIEDDIKTILKHYYCHFGAREFKKIFDHNTYSKRTGVVYDVRNYEYPEYDFDVVKKTLAKHFKQKKRKYLPDFVQRLMNASSDQELEDILKLTSEERQRVVKYKGSDTADLFSQFSLSEQFTRVQSMQGLKNYGSTCFVAASVWQIICSPYSAYLSAAEGMRQATNIKSDQQLTVEQCLSQLRSETTNNEQQVQLLQLGLAKCLSTLIRLRQQGMHPAMQRTYKQLLDLCIQGAVKGIFDGFESFDELLVRIAGQKRVHRCNNEESAMIQRGAPVIQARHLQQQDCAEFLAPLLQLVLNKENLHKCAFRVLTERQVMKNGEIVTITDDPQISAQVTQDGQSPPDTFIFSLPVVPELADRDDFSVQLLLDQAFSYQNVAHRQHSITVQRSSFRHAVQHFPQVLEWDMEKEEEWDILRERQVLLVREVPEVITIQPKMPAEFSQRAAIARRLNNDQAGEITLTFRKISPDDSLETVKCNYRVCTRVFYVEDGVTKVRHYRCAINDATKGQLLIDDLDVYRTDGDLNDCSKCGILCLMVLKQVVGSQS